MSILESLYNIVQKMDKIGRALGASVRVSIISTKKERGKQVIVVENKNKKLRIPQLDPKSLGRYKVLGIAHSRMGRLIPTLGNQEFTQELLYCLWLASKNTEDFYSRVAGYVAEPSDKKGFNLKVIFYEKKKKV